MFDVTPGHAAVQVKHAIVRSLIILSRYIKLSSPKLNNMAIVGSCLIYGAVILLGVDHATLIHETGFPFVCMVRRFLLYNLKSLIKLLELFLTHRSQGSSIFPFGGILAGIRRHVHQDLPRPPHLQHAQQPAQKQGISNSGNTIYYLLV